MERNEEIKCASKDYVNYLLDKQEYHNEDYTEDDIRQAFENGAMFADRNPDLSALWHDASEEPICGKRLLLLHTNSVVSIFEHTGKSSWSMLVSCGICQYAYISELLPKGGEK